MDALRQGIGLRGIGQQNPVVAYKQEGFDMFDEMIYSLRHEVGKKLLLIRAIRVGDSTKKIDRVSVGNEKSNSIHKKSIGRNDPCPCGSGKKYKNCCGK